VTASQSNSSTASIYAWGAQVELGSSPGKYVASAGSAVYSSHYELPREWDSAGACLGLLVEEARTNIALYARDLTNAAYVKTSATAALTATGVDGVTNTASTLTASAANGSAVQRITSASAARSLSMFIKRRTGTGTVTISHGATTGSDLVTDVGAAFGVRNANTTLDSETATAINVSSVAAGTYGVNATGITATIGKVYALTATYTSSTTRSMTVGFGGATVGVVLTAATPLTATTYHAAVTTGAIDIFISATGAAETLTVDAIALLEVVETDITSSINSSTWTRVSITNETITNPCVAIKLATSGDAIDVDLVQSEAGAFITSPIYTGSASVTRAVDNINVASSVMAYSQSAVTLYAKGTPQNLDASATTQDAMTVDDGTANERVSLFRASANPSALVTDGGSNVANIDAGTWSVSTSGKFAMSAAANDAATSFNAGVVGTDVTVTMPTVRLISVGSQRGSGLNPFNGHIAQVMILPRAMSDADLQTVTT
jgi:hypothetical protein